MYTLKITNNFIYDLKINAGDSYVPSGGSSVFDKQGTLNLMVPGIGYCLFLDLGDKKLEGYPEISETWGVLIRSQSTEAYYRYEGEGNLYVVVDAYGTSILSTTNGTLIPIVLDELVVDTSGIQIN